MNRFRLQTRHTGWEVHLRDLLGKSPGPIISLFEIEPAEGVRVSKFVNLSDDLARVMKAQRVRIIAPIPGSKSVGIELPNDNKSIVYLKTILNSNKFIENNYQYFGLSTKSYDRLFSEL